MLIQPHSIIWKHGFRGGQGLQHAVASRPMLRKAACLMLSLCVRHSCESRRKQEEFWVHVTHIGPAQRTRSLIDSSGEIQGTGLLQILSQAGMAPAEVLYWMNWLRGLSRSEPQNLTTADLQRSVNAALRVVVQGLQTTVSGCLLLHDTPVCILLRAHHPFDCRARMQSSGVSWRQQGPSAEQM